MTLSVLFEPIRLEFGVSDAQRVRWAFIKVIFGRGTGSKFTLESARKAFAITQAYSAGAIRRLGDLGLIMSFRR